MRLLAGIDLNRVAYLYRERPVGGDRIGGNHACDRARRQRAQRARKVAYRPATYATQDDQAYRCGDLCQMAVSLTTLLREQIIANRLSRRGRVSRSAVPWASGKTPFCGLIASTGRLMIAVLGGLADVERDLIRTRTAEGPVRASISAPRQPKYLSCRSFRAGFFAGPNLAAVTGLHYTSSVLGPLLGPAAFGYSVDYWNSDVIASCVAVVCLIAAGYFFAGKPPQFRLPRVSICRPQQGHRKIRGFTGFSNGRPLALPAA
jgi:hypothetical protein